MTRVAQERISDLFALAETEARAAGSALPNRYVTLARRIGMRYNVRLLSEYRDLYCRGCSIFWVEGRTVRTRLRAGRQVRTCLVCGRVRRVPLRPPRATSRAVEVDVRRPVPAEAPALVGEQTEELELEPDEGEEG